MVCTLPLESVTRMPAEGTETTVPDESAATVVTWARARAATLNVVLPVDAVAVLVATTALDEDEAEVAFHAVASVSAWAAVWTAVSLVLIAWYALS